MKYAFAAACSLLLAGLCLADPPCSARTYGHRPATRKAVYRPIHHGKEILIAEAAFLLFDYDAYEAYHFNGPYPPPSPGVPLGVDGGGTEVRGVPPLQHAQQDDDRRVVTGYEGDQPIRPLRSSDATLASLRASCASCHTGARAKGGFVIFDQSGAPGAKVDWKAVRDEIESGRMPPPTSGKPAVSPQDRAEVRRLAGR